MSQVASLSAFPPPPLRFWSFPPVGSSRREGEGHGQQGALTPTAWLTPDLGQLVKDAGGGCVRVTFQTGSSWGTTLTGTHLGGGGSGTCGPLDVGPGASVSQQELWNVEFGFQL